ncbi:MAG: septation protein IspZ [Alphaproteobacteria bacterium]|nr:septation protein IspZ [Alphaproteobacteria bacterium]
MTTSDQNSPSSTPKTSGGMKALLEYGPLVLFFLVNSKYGIYHGTAVLVVATVVSLSISWWRDRYVPKILAFGCAAVVFFGALTLIFNDDTFIKLKPTVVSLTIAVILWGGQRIGKNPLKSIMGDSLKMQLPDSGWRGLTRLWVLMFASLAVANEMAWRNLSTDDCVTFKVFGLTGLSLVFGVAIAIYLSRYATPDEG